MTLFALAEPCSGCCIFLSLQPARECGIKWLQSSTPNNYRNIIIERHCCLLRSAEICDDVNCILSLGHSFLTTTGAKFDTAAVGGVI
jgi:hypothetical protein